MNFELLEDDATARDLVWRPFYARLRQDPARLEDYQYQVRRHGRSQIEKALEAALEKRVEFELAESAGHVARSVRPFDEVFEVFAGLQSPTDVLLRPEVQRRWLAWAALLEREKLKSPQQAAQAISTAFAATQDAVQIFEKLKKALFVSTADRLRAHLDAYPCAQEAGAELQALCLADAQHQAWKYQQSMRRLTLLLVQEFAQIKRQNGWVDMNDLERLAYTLMSDEALSGWIQERLDHAIGHVLIDEFQDTSPLQWLTLFAWLSSYSGVGGGAQAPRLFIVGDPKQSIYRFRRAEPQIFLAAQTFIRDKLGGSLLSCDHTRRLAVAVTHAVNSVMRPIDGQRPATPFRAHTTASAFEGAVWRLPLIERVPTPEADRFKTIAPWRPSLTEPLHQTEEPLKALECQQLATFIHDLVQGQGVKPEDVMVLARKRESLAWMEQALKACGIPSEQPEKLDLASAPEVDDLLSLMDALVSTSHDLSLAQALRSPVFGATDDELLEIAQLQKLSLQNQGFSTHLSWFDVLQTQAQAWASKRMGAWGPQLQRWKTWLESLPTHDALSLIYADGAVLHKYAAASTAPRFSSVQANLQALLWAALSLGRGRYASAYAFIRALKTDKSMQVPRAQSPHAVRLLTIHGAKGLEAPWVLMLDTHAGPVQPRNMSVLVHWPVEARVPSHFCFLVTETKAPPSLETILVQELDARAVEERNALYVAMTRAERHLVISASLPHRENSSSWWSLLTRQLPDLELFERTLSQQNIVKQPVLNTEPEVRTIKLVEQQSQLGLWVQNTRFPMIDGNLTVDQQQVSTIGQAMHRLLEWQAMDKLELPAANIRSVQREFRLDQYALRKAVQSAQLILRGEAAWAWQSSWVDWSANEVTITFEGLRLRLDRLVLKRLAPHEQTQPLITQQWWVLDYKLTRQPLNQQDLITQMQTYLKAVALVAPHSSGISAEVKGALLTSDGRCLLHQPAN
jgi:ATP-dependent helicase/nuclease subunit A